MNTPRNFGEFTWSTCLFPIDKECLNPTFEFRELKSINLVFSIFIDNLLKTSHRSINSISDCMSWNRFDVFLQLVQTVVSSAKIMALLLVKQLLKSFTYSI